MKKINRKHLIIIVLILIAGIGLSFAYFTSRILLNGTGATSYNKTANVGDTTITVEGELNTNEANILPGHKSLSVLKVTATGDRSASYNLYWNGSNHLKTDIKYHVYKSSTKIEPSISCKQIHNTVKVGEDIKHEQYEECTLNNFEPLGEEINSGAIAKENDSVKVLLVQNESIQAISEGKTVYYYVVLEYENTENNQVEDSDKSLEGTVSIELLETPTTASASKTILANNTIITDEIGKYEIVDGILLYNNYSVNYYANLDGDELIYHDGDRLYSISVPDYSSLETDGTVYGESITTGLLDATWNSETSTCTCNGEPVYDIINWMDITDESYCKKATLYEGTYVTYQYEDVTDQVKYYKPTKGLNAVEDNDGTSYYFRGNVDNNWIKFGQWDSDTPDIYYGYPNSGTVQKIKEFSSLNACNNDRNFNKNCELNSRAGKDMYWRIIRINGDGSIRLIYAGTNINSTTGGDTQIGLGAFNSLNDDNAYVGFMYGTTGSDAYAATHANTNPSEIKNLLDTWYINNLVNYSDFINQEAHFCVDKTAYTREGSWSNGYTYTPGGGYAKLQTYYGAYLRSYRDSSKSTISPNMNCSNNNILNTSVGLITADELTFSGLSNGYLKTNLQYWTISPAYYNNAAYNFYVNENNSLSTYDVLASGAKFGIRPVINLKANVQLTGTGTVDDPYIVVGL